MVNRYLFKLMSYLFFPVLLLLSSCATTSLTTTWHDAQYSGQNTLQDVLIIGVIKEETIRRLYEDSFAAKFAESNIQAIPSYSLQNSDIKPTRESIDRAIAESGAQFVLITRHLGTDRKEHYRPPEPVYTDPFYSRYHNYHPFAYRQMYTPGYTYTVTTVSLEANLYDARTEKLVWSARSQSVDPKMSSKYLDDLISVFSRDMIEKGLL